MKIKCDKCPHEFEDNQTECPKCHTKYTLGASLARFFKRLIPRFKKATAIICPCCGTANPASQKYCKNPRCRIELTIRVAISVMIIKSWLAWKRFERKYPVICRNWRIAYLLASMVLFGIVYLAAKETLMANSGSAVIISGVLLIFATILVMWTIPPTARRDFYRQLTPSTRLALVVNYFTFLILFHLLVITFRDFAGFLAVGVLFTHVCILVMFGHAEYVWRYAGWRFFFDVPDSRIYPSDPQGRDAEHN